MFFYNRLAEKYEVFSIVIFSMLIHSKPFPCKKKHDLSLVFGQNNKWVRNLCVWVCTDIPALSRTYLFSTQIFSSSKIMQEIKQIASFIGYSLIYWFLKQTWKISVEVNIIIIIIIIIIIYGTLLVNAQWKWHRSQLHGKILYARHTAVNWINIQWTNDRHHNLC
jgi:hypothetical protein